MQTISKTKSPQKRVLVFPAQISPVSDRQVYFLFSLRQMEDILTDGPIRPVPFSPEHVDGVAEWRGNVLPVVSMESCLGFESLDTGKIQRLMVVRSAVNGSVQNDVDRMMLRVIPPIRMLTLPIECSPVSDDWIPMNCLAKGVYEWEDKFLVAAHIEKILGEGVN
jgi:chemotaxis signal transduction protein